MNTWHVLFFEGRHQQILLISLLYSWIYLNQSGEPLTKLTLLNLLTLTLLNDFPLETRQPVG